ncbi:LLM class F420-dependent oxidoreductase [Candidatus Bathyarchaeota archaeon]|nr:LLM class F420-dependent oxidoreductase [Candidatus Bathyarchaeota archaeon]
MRLALTKFGLMIPQGWRLDLPRDRSPTEQFELMIKIAEEIERLGFDSGFLYDHLITYPTITTESCFECYTSLAAIAMRTSKLRLGQLVTCTSYRNPALVAKMAATLDVISGGRLEFGIGAGWYEHEYQAYGYRFESPSVRIRQLREAVQIIRKMWTEEKATFHGKYFSVDGAINSPKPIQKPHPPIMIGGNGEKLTLKAVARLADRSDLSAAITLDECVRKFGIIDQHCRDFGRDPSTIERTLHREVYVARDGRAARSRALQSKPSGVSEEAFLKSRIIGDPKECASQFNDYVEQAGVRYFILRAPDAVELESLRLLAGEVFPNVK